MSRGPAEASQQKPAGKPVGSQLASGETREASGFLAPAQSEGSGGQGDGGGQRAHTHTHTHKHTNTQKTHTNTHTTRVF